MAIRRYLPPIWYRSSDFVSTEQRPGNEQTFKLNFQSVMENKRRLSIKANDGEIKNLVEKSARRNTKKSTKYVGAIYVRSPWEINLRVTKKKKKKRNPFRLARISEDNSLGWKIVLKISQLSSRLHFLASCSFFGQPFKIGRASCRERV
mgnify:CR=1 FL=1